MHTLSDINAFGLGSDATDIEMEEFFWNDSFWMPAGWTAPGHKGSKPGLAGTSIVPGESRFLVFGHQPEEGTRRLLADHRLGERSWALASVTSARSTARPTTASATTVAVGHPAGPDVLEKHDIPVNSEMSVFSYRYGILNDDATSFTPVIKNRLAA